MATKKINKKPTPKKPPAQVAKTSTPPQVVPYPDAGKRVADFEGELDKQLAAGEQLPGQEPKRGPGRPRKDAQAAGPEIDIGPALQLVVIDRMLRIPFSVWAESTELDELKLTDREASDLAAATKELLDYYIPNLPPALIMWSNFTVASLVILQPRFARIAELKKEKQQANNPGKDGSQQAGQGGPVTPVKFPTNIDTQKV